MTITQGPPIPWLRELRDHQVEAIEQAVDAFERGVGLVLIDAPTGSGKTLIAEMVRRQLGTRGLYTCTTKTLQDQFASDYEYARVLKGRANYPTLNRPDLFEVDGFDRVTCADCDQAGGECSWCDEVEFCPYQRAKDVALNSPLSCINTAYLLAECNMPRSRFSGWPFVVVDECDLLENGLMGFVTIRISERMKRRLGIDAPARKTVHEAWVEWFKKTTPIVKERVRSLPFDTLREQRFARRAVRLYDQMQWVEQRIEDGGWVYDGYREGEIVFKPVQVNDLGREYLWRHARRWLCMSASLISPQEFVSSLGWEEDWEYVEVPSTFPVERRPVRVCSVAPMTNKAKDESWPIMVDTVERVLDLHPDERVLVHTVSYHLASYLWENVSNDRALITYRDARSRTEALESFEKTEGAVLFAPSLDRGVDLPDDLCRVVVVAKVPFPHLGDKQVSARLHARGGQLWYSTQAARTLVQMTGRGMRHEDDRCVTYLLDGTFPRFWRGNKNLLPRWWSEALEWNGPWKQLLVG